MVPAVIDPPLLRSVMTLWLGPGPRGRVTGGLAGLFAVCLDGVVVCFFTCLRVSGEFGLAALAAAGFVSVGWDGGAGGSFFGGADALMAVAPWGASMLPGEPYGCAALHTFHAAQQRFTQPRLEHAWPQRSAFSPMSQQTHLGVPGGKAACCALASEGREIIDGKNALKKIQNKCTFTERPDCIATRRPLRCAEARGVLGARQRTSSTLRTFGLSRTSLALESSRS